MTGLKLKIRIPSDSNLICRIQPIFFVVVENFYQKVKEVVIIGAWKTWIFPKVIQIMFIVYCYLRDVIGYA